MGITDFFLGIVCARLRLAEEVPRPIFPASTRELLERLPGAPEDWAAKAAETLVREFGTPKDRRLWRAFLRVTEEVRSGRFPADDLLDCYRQAKGPKAKNPGAVFNTALRNKGWIWEGAS
jgi:hypothetical protein